MKRNKICLILILCFFWHLASTQTLTEILNDIKWKNYKEIENKIQKNQSTKNASDKEKKSYYRWKWIWDSRIDSSGSFEKYGNAMTEYFSKMYPDGKLDEMILKSGTNLTWSCIGPNSRPSGSNSIIGRGRINCIWINPNNFQEILIGANSGGLWKTLNGGTTWECLTNSYMLGGVFDIAVDSNNKSIIYIATGVRLAPRASLGLSGNYTLGLFKSTDSGFTWTKCNITTTNGEYFNRVLIDPNNSNIIFALSTKKIYKSTNAGASWSVTTLQIPDGDALIDMLFKPNNSNTLYVSGFGNFIYKTIDGGTSWSKCTLKEPYASSKITIATNPSDSEDLYAFYSDAAGDPIDPGNRIEKSEDGGNTWNVKYRGKLSGNNYAHIIKVSSDGDVYAGGIHIRKSIDDCSSFSSSLSSGLIHV